MTRPHFKDIKSFEEFNSYYWYREELIEICKNLGISHTGYKQDLNYNIQEYFRGNSIKPQKKRNITRTIVTEISLETKLLDCNFTFSQKFRDFFAKETGVTNFKFHADMVATVRKVKETKDETFTLQDLLDIYYKKKEYAKYDKSSCQWNQFLKDFCQDENNNVYENKLKAAAYLWKLVRGSTDEKKYHPNLLQKYKEEMKNFQ